MKALIMLPIVMLIIVGAATELEGIAKDSSQKAIDLAEDMNSAMDCAGKGVPISVCSPDIMNHDVSKEIDKFESTLNDLKKSLEKYDLDEEELELLANKIINERETLGEELNSNLNDNQNNDKKIEINSDL